MGASNKVILFKTSATMPYSIPIVNTNQEADVTNDACIADKALRILEEMEEIWEIDHNNVELRDRFHLLRHYLKRFLS